MVSKSIIELQETLRALSEQHPDRKTFGAAIVFLDAHLQLARAATQSDPTLAIEQFKLAESCQGCIGTFATGSGEGLASMLALYEIMAERAELEERLAHASQLANDRVFHLQEALDIWKVIQADPNLNELLPEKNLEPLKEQLEGWKSEQQNSQMSEPNESEQERQPNPGATKDPLHGMTLEKILVRMVARYGWAEMSDRIPIRCFQSDPSIKSSLTFLRKTPWARKKLEDWYAYAARRFDMKIENEAE